MLGFLFGVLFTVMMVFAIRVSRCSTIEVYADSNASNHRWYWAMRSSNGVTYARNTGSYPDQASAVAGAKLARRLMGSGQIVVRNK